MTTFPVIDAFALLKLHVPEATVSVIVMENPVQTMESPLIVPALGKGLTDSVAVVESEPQMLVTL